MCTLWLFCCGLASASLPPNSLARLDYTALVNYWGHVLDGYGYGMDPLGLRTNITRNLGLTTNTVSLGFDNIGQITSWSAKEFGDGLRLNEQFGFGFDKAGNLFTRTNAGLVQSFNCDVLNQLTNVTHNNVMTVSGATPAPATTVTVNGQAAQRYGDMTFAATNLALADGSNSFTNIAVNTYGLRATNIITANLPASVTLQWDSDGNLTNDGTRSFAYSPEDQLTNITVAGVWKTDFIYDGLGRRRIERDYGWQGGQWVKTNETRYIYDGYLPIQERDSNNVARVTYTRGVDLSSSLAGAGGIGGLLARTDTNGSTFYHADGAGNITALMDGNQNIAARYLYGAFGRLVGKWGALADANVMQFSSMPVHRLSGIVQFPLRPTYDSIFQRFLTRDPIGELGGFNLYKFVGNNPLSYLDPWGFQGVAGVEPAPVGEITEEILQGLEDNFARPRSGPPSFMEQVGENAALNAKEMEMRQQGLDPNMTYLEAPKQPTKPLTADEIIDYIRKHPLTLGPCPTVARYVGKDEARVARESGLIPNVTPKGELKAVFVTADELELDASKVEVMYQVGSLDPRGSSESPTHVILGDARDATFTYGGNVAGGQGTELTTYNQIPVMLVLPLRGTK